ncbi:MAG: hypothetical protein ICV72_11755 [Aldersonia sp.]|nr:hypothetical protein [Aldersonia sp.]
MTGFRRARLATAAVLLVAAAGVAAPVAAAPTCAGRRATMIGTRGDDTIDGSSRDDVIVTFGGNDIVDGGGGDDVICAGSGTDHLLGGPGADVVIAGRGEDSFSQDPGRDRLSGGRGRDILTLVVPTTLDLAIGRSRSRFGADRLRGIDAVWGSEGPDVIRGTRGPNDIFGEGGADVVIGRGGRDVLGAGPGNDSVSGGGGTDLIIDDNFFGGRRPTNERWVGGAGRDSVWLFTDDGPAHADLHEGTLTTPVLHAAIPGFEHIIATPKDDVLVGNAAPNTLWGGWGDDVMLGRGGNDHLVATSDEGAAHGGAGRDICSARITRSCEVYSSSDMPPEIEALMQRYPLEEELVP